MSDRRKPYTEKGIRRVRCVRCDAPARYQWQVCADENTWRPICAECDIALNKLVMRWMFGRRCRFWCEERLKEYERMVRSCER